MKVAVALVVLLFMQLSGCNTMEGFGEDMEAVGEAIRNKADRD